MNKYAIQLIDGKQPLYKTIYILSPVKLKTLKTYIKTYQITGFIQPLSLLQKLSYYLIKSRKETLVYISIIQTSTILKSRIDISCLSLAKS